MAEPMRPHAQFLDVADGPFLLAGLGALITKRDDFSNPDLQCLVLPQQQTSPVPDDQPLQFGKLLHPGVTALNTLKVGRIYGQGWLTEEPRRDEHKWLIDFEVEKGTNGPKEMVRDFRPNGAWRFLERDAPRTDRMFREAVKIVKCAAARSGGQLPRNEAFAVFNELEIARFYYANSNILTKALIQGDFEPDRFTQQVISTEHGEPYFDAAEGIHRLEYHRKFPEEDVRFIARTVFDPSGWAMAGAVRMHRSLTRTAQIDPQGLGFLRTYFPFLGKVRLEVSGRVLLNKGAKPVLFVDRIESCNQPFPFKVLSAQSNRIKRVSTTKDVSEKPPQGAPVVSGPGTKSGSSMDSQALAHPNGPVVGSAPDQRRFTAPLPVVVFEAERETEGSASRVRFTVNNELLNTSPGGLSAGTATAVRQLLVDEVVGGVPPPELSAFIKSLHSLKQKSGFMHMRGRLRTLPVGFEAWTAPSTDDVYCVLPRVPTDGGRYRSFSFADRNNTRRRHVVVAEVRSVKGYHYIISAEDRTGKSSNRQWLGVLIAWHPKAVELSPIQLAKFLRGTVTDKTWAIKRFGWEGSVLPHETVTKPLHLRILDNLRARPDAPSEEAASGRAVET